MNRKELIKKYIDFFKNKKHAEIKSASLIPENDPTVLFTTAGMHPLVPFLLGQPHPAGKRIVDVQKCIRTGDIEDVGDSTHLTFFEMLGNWSLGDYWKKEAIEWSYEFLVKVLRVDIEKLNVSVFAGDKDAPRDEESAGAWKKLGIPENRIFYLPKKDNWWGPAGDTGPCGPDTEMFIDTGLKKCSKECKPGCYCGKYVEIWNDVFMEYEKTKDGKYIPLKQKNVDTGMGVERTATILQGKKDVYETDIFQPLLQEIKKYEKKEIVKSERIVADHIKAATFIMAEKVVPSNIGRGYVLRRLIRRAIRHARLLGVSENILVKLSEIVINMYKDNYQELVQNHTFITKELNIEEERFNKTLENGLKEFNKIAKEEKNISGKNAFLLFQSYGFPLEMIEELGKELEIKVDSESFKNEFEEHQRLSRVGAEQQFKGGLADAGVQTTKLHTATHLMFKAMQIILKKPSLEQKGANITPERIRFDFNFERKLTDEEVKAVEKLVNEKISEKIPVVKKEMAIEEAKKTGAHGQFAEKYGAKVFVYSIGEFSKEICGGPHVNNTSELGHFKIMKQEAVSAGVRRVKAVLE